MTIEELAKKFGLGRGDMIRIVHAFEIAIAASFLAEGGRMTKTAVQDRTDICMKLFASLRGDLKWSLSKTLDHIPGYLRCELAGIAYSPEAANGLWRSSQL